MKLALLLAVAQLVAAGCSDVRPSPTRNAMASAASTSEPTPTAVGSQATPPDLPGQWAVSDLVRLGFLYRCETVPFSVDLLFRPGNAELDPDPAAFALRQFLAQSGPDFDSMPDVGWRRAGTAIGRTEFINNANPPAPPGTVVWARVEAGPNGWQVGAWGDCQARRVPEAPRLSLGWWLPEGQPDPAATILDTLVAVDGCNTGPVAADILEPSIIETDSSVVVILSALPDAGGCPPAPLGQFTAPTRLEIALPSRVDGRAPLDGSQFPPRSALETPIGFGGAGG